MSTRDQRALLYDLVGTFRETKDFGFLGKYGCKAEMMLRMLRKRESTTKHCQKAKEEKEGTEHGVP